MKTQLFQGRMTKMSFLRGAWLALFMTLILREASCVSDPVEVAALKSIKRFIGDGFNRLENWVGDDPCGTPPWTGVFCGNPMKNGTRFVNELRLLNLNFTGTLAPDFGNLSQLTILDVMWNNITGSIPPEIGNLGNLVLLLLNGNKLSGVLPPELGNLSNLNRIQIDQNTISGPVPATFQNLNKAKHFHMNNNSLSGTIPKELGRLEILVHLLLDNNNLSGELPPELSNISTMLILQLDNNNFTGSIPSNYSQLPQLLKMSMRSCNLSGAVPDIPSFTSLSYLDLSHNQLTGSLTSGNVSKNLTYMDVSFNQLSGGLPSDYLEAPNLEFLIVRNNSLNGTVEANVISGQQFTSSDSVLVLDLQDNTFTGINAGLSTSVQNISIWMYGNPYCSGPNSSKRECQDHTADTNVSASSPTVQILAECTDATCDASQNQELNYGLLELGQCQCANPLKVGYRLKSPGFAFFPPYETGFQDYLSSGISLLYYQVNISSYDWEPGPRLAMNLKLFPTNDTHLFNSTEVARLYTIFATWNISDNNTFGPYEVLSFDIGFPYNASTEAGASKGLSSGAIAGIVIGAAALTAIAVAAAAFFIIRRRPRYSGGRSRLARHERIKVAGVKDFTYGEMAKATNNFDSSMQIGQGGYGKVYKAVLDNGAIAAIKRAQVGSLQGSKEFYTEIELLSRCHHRNLVALLGYCDDEGEQMLVYEFMSGNLRDYLDSHSKRPLDFPTRLQIALGSAKGILYLHTEANPPIYHRDIKASNILLDEKRKAKVADFGLSKLAPVSELEGTAGGHVSTVVKGTPGYLDPEYFLTHKLTDKSDVYSFGVVLLELVTGMQPISHGKNLVREVNLAYEAGMMLSIVDPRMGSYPAESLEPLVRLAVSCCKDDTDARPNMSDVVRELEVIWRTIPGFDSVVSFETSVDAEDNNPKDPRTPPNNPYISSDIDGSGLMSGTIPNVAPR